MAVSPAIQKHFDTTTTYLDKIDKGIDGVSGDVTELNKLIAQLQSTQGQLTPEDQTLLDQIEARGLAAGTKIEALDALTPPPAPPTA